MATAAHLQRHVTRPLIFAVLFLTANVILFFGVSFNRWTDVDDDDPTARHSVLRSEMVVRRRMRGVNDVTSPDDAQTKDFGCGHLMKLTAPQFVSSGWTKAVYRGELDGAEVAVKRVNFNGHDMNQCLSRADASLWMCYKKAAAKIHKEIVLLKELLHYNVLRVLGYCIPNVDEELSEDLVGGTGGIALITELGESLDIIRLLQSSWEDRLRLTLGVTKVVHHLAHSPLGSLVMNDFRRQQFVLVDGELKLSDVDDVEFEEPYCSSDDQCTIRHKLAELELPVQCVRGRCAGYNEKQNIYNAGRHFVTFLLPHGAPASLRPLVDEVVNAYSNVSWDVGHILAAVEHIYQLFVSGKYLDVDGSGQYRQVLNGYRRLENSDLPGLFDYRCQLTLSGTGCTMSVFDEAEAAAICDGDSDCRAFVITPNTSWTGRRIVHFKSNFSSPVVKHRTTLFVKL